MRGDVALSHDEEALAQALRDAEGRYRALLDSALDAIVGMDAAGRIVEFNRVAEAIFGHARSDVLGRTLADVIVPPRLRGAHARGLERLRDTGVPKVLGRRLELPGWRSDGTEFPAEVSIVAAPSGAGDVFYGFIRDVTERRQAESDRARAELLAAHTDELTEITIRLEHAYRELEAFSYSVSHDLRTPLRAVSGFSEIMLEDYGPQLDEQGRKHLQRIGAAAGEMSTIIDALLQLGRIGRAEPQTRDVELGPIVLAAFDELRAVHPERRVELRLHEGLHAHCDPQLVRIAFDNLLGNAWKFARDDVDAFVEVGVEQDGTFFVRDNGIGFDMREASRLFVPFRRLSTAAHLPGTGVGLATVERVAQRHGGRVWAESEPGAGATFWFTLSA